jgi:type 1 glutamine amidotransferase
MAACAWAQPKVKVLFLTGEIDSQYHDWRASTEYLRGVLERSGRFEVKVVEQPAGIGEATLRPFDVVVLNYNGPRWGGGTERAVEEFVRAGKGLVSFHGVTYGTFYGQVFDGRWKAGPDGGWLNYPSLIGARWQPANIGHGRRHVFDVEWQDRAHPIAQGLPEKFTANDELYHKLDLLPQARVLASAMSEGSTGGTGKVEPIVWAAPFGKGRTMHLTLGHDLSAMSQAGFVAAFSRGVEWAATGAVAPAVRTAEAPVRVLAVTGGHSYPAAFYTLFEGYPDIVWSHATSQREALRQKDLAKRYDTIVLHDMAQDLEAPLRENLKAFVDAGKGIVSTHHAIIDYTAWPWWWREVVGGKYFDNEEYDKAYPDHPKSVYKEGVNFTVTPTKAGLAHPVTRDVGPLVVHDEAYKNLFHAPGIEVLMETDFELTDRPQVWIGPARPARVVYIQIGHEESTMRSPGYRKLVRNAILWTAGRR